MAWYNASWPKRVPVTLDNTGGATFTSGQVLVRLRSEFPGWAAVNSDLSDLRVTDSDGTTLLSWWPVPGYSVAGNTADLWVNASVSSSSSKTIYIYYGNSGASDASSYSSTMSKLPELTASTLAAYQLDNGSGTSATDASGNSNTGTLVGAPTWQGSDGGNYKNSGTPVAFSSGSHLLFNGSSQYMTCGNALNTTPSTGLIAFWFKWVSVPGSDKRLMTKYDGTNGLDILYRGATNVLDIRLWHSSTLVNAASSGAVLNDTNWHHVAISWGTGAATIDGIRAWVDGVQVCANQAYTGAWANVSVPLTIGCYNDGGTVTQYVNAYFDGIIVENTQHDIGWIRAAWSRTKYWTPPLYNLTRSASNPIISATTEYGSTATAVYEPTPVISSNGSNVNLYYTAAGTQPPTHAVICKAHTTTGNFPTTWTKDGTIVGQGTGSESNDACRPYLYTTDNTNLTLFYADLNTGVTSNLRYITSTDGGSTWSSPTTLLSTATIAAAVSGGQGIANIRIILVGSTYHMFAEVAFSSGAQWRITRWTSSSLTGTYTYQATITALQPGTGSQTWSSGELRRVNGRFVMIYHATPPSGATTLPSWMYQAALDGAITADSSWVISADSPIAVPISGDIPGGVGSTADWQAADAKFLDVNGVAYVMYDGDDNGATVAAQVNTLTYTGTIAQLLDARPCPALGLEELQPAITGSLSSTLAAATTSATGTVAISGSASATLGSLTVNATGTVAIAGSLSSTLAAVTVAATGVVAIIGSGSSTLAALTVNGAGTIAISGSLSSTLAALAVNGTGTVAITGAASVTLDALTVTASGGATLTGSLISTLANVTCAATGTVAIAGSLSATLVGMTVSGNGSLAITGSAIVTLGNAVVAATGTSADAISGSLAATLATLTVSAAGTVESVVAAIPFRAVIPFNTTRATIAFNPNLRRL